MSYFQDGTQKFGIPDSPVTINAITYIAEDISITRPVKVVEISDSSGAPIGQTHVPGNPTGTAKLQFASSTTAVPAGGTGLSFTLEAVQYYVTQVGEKYTQGQYAYCDISFAKKIN